MTGDLYGDLCGDKDGALDVEQDAEPSRFEQVRRLLGDGLVYRFCSEPRRGVYVCLLLALLRRREAHEIEVLHDDLFDEVQTAVRQALSVEYDAVQFRQDVEQLCTWGNLVERVEPTRIRSLADRGRSKLLLRLDPGTAAFLQFLQAQSDPLPPGIRDQGANLLADIHGALKEAAATLQRARTLISPAGDGDSEFSPEVGRNTEFEELVLRAAHLVHEADARAERIARELVTFGDLLTRFIAEPFRIDSLYELSSWLERYVDRYLSTLEEKGRAVRLALWKLRGADLLPLLERAGRLERERLSNTPGGLLGNLRLSDAASAAASLTTIFSVHEGLTQLCRRIDGRAREVVRRIQRHVEAVRMRNVRTEAIRSRISELFELPENATPRALAFLQELLAPLGQHTDGRPGTPGERSAPPRPARRHEAARTTFRGARLEQKHSTPSQSRELERRRLLRLSRFVEQHVLRGQNRARLSNAKLSDLEDGQALIGALSAFLLRGGRARPYLDFKIDRAEGSARATLRADNFTLELPDAPVRRKEST